MVTTEDDAEDSEAEMIKEYTASGHGKGSII
jgi:hypothetical protein